MSKLTMRKKSARIIGSAVKAGRESLLENEAELIAREYRIKVPSSLIAKSAKEAGDASRKLGLPVVMKIISKDILHKSDVGGVKTNITSARGAKGAYSEIVKNARKSSPKAEIEGVLVQEMAPKGNEFVIGATRDPQFGPTVMFGLGGIYVELFKDVSFRLAPLSVEEAVEMMKEIKSAPLLTGFRGSKPLDMQAAAKTIVSVGEIMSDHVEISSIDINPLFIYTKGVLAVDVRIILSKPSSEAHH